MATDKKKEVKMKDLKPAKDAKGGVARQTNTQRGTVNRGTRGTADGSTGRNLS